MGTWKTFISGVTNTIGNAINNGITKIKDVFTSTVKNTVATVDSFFKNGSTVVGINVNQIPNMKEAIRSYVSDIQSNLNKLDQVDPKTAFKGEMADALYEYVGAVKSACQAVASNMLAFNDQLTKVQEAYMDRDSDMKSLIKKDTESTRSAFKSYTEGSK